MLVPFKPQFQAYFVPMHYTKLCPMPPGKRSRRMSTLYVRVAEIGLNGTYVHVAELGSSNSGKESTTSKGQNGDKMREIACFILAGKIFLRPFVSCPWLDG